MARKTPAEIKAYFETNDKPTEAQFGEFIDNSVQTCKRYKGLISQAGDQTDPVITVLENTLGGVPVWTSHPNEEEGIASITATLTDAFTINKTIVFFQTSGEIVWSNNGSEIVINSTGGFTNQPILIEVYD